MRGGVGQVLGFIRDWDWVIFAMGVGFGVFNGGGDTQFWSRIACHFYNVSTFQGTNIFLFSFIFSGPIGSGRQVLRRGIIGFWFLDQNILCSPDEPIFLLYNLV